MRVICHAHVQRWNENDYAENLFVLDFDATDRVMELGRDRAMSIRDNSHESDDLAPPEILSVVESIEEGTFFVTCENAIRAFFER